MQNPVEAFHSQSALRMETLCMQVSELGQANPLPPLPCIGVSPPPMIDSNLPEEDRRYLGWGDVNGTMPYSLQDQYVRDPQWQELRVAVLENLWLKAVFLLDYGGRLWSLIDKRTERELLHNHPILQPANLARRNAWFSGGIEWNFGVPGHTTLTCSPVFAARVQGADREPVLRLYEWERIRCMPYQMDFWLAPDRPLMLARMRIINPHKEVTPVYWWSNIAVDEAEDVRVLAPAESAIHTQYEVGLTLAQWPKNKGRDVSYPTNGPVAADYFFRIPDGQRPWLTALDGKGYGLVQTSTALARGRKLFIWGMSSGGRQWQQYLNGPGHYYIEIQAGLARTQYECLPMPPESQWEWLEAYGPLEAAPELVHGADWAAACREVEARLETLVPGAWIEEELLRSASAAHRAPETLHHRGSGWGALERLRRQTYGEPPFCDDAMFFDDESLTTEQAPWLSLLCEGSMPCPLPDTPIVSWMKQPAWRDLLEQAIRNKDRGNWTAWYQTGVMRYCAGEMEPARQAWECSVSLEPSAWAYRNLAFLAWQEKRWDDAVGLYYQAIRLAPENLPLVREYCEMAMEAGRPELVLQIVEGLTPELRSHPRIKLALARAALAMDDLDVVEQVFGERLVVADIREGEVSLSDLWYAFQERRLARREGRPVDDDLRRHAREAFPVPDYLDFRMAGKVD